MFCPACGAEAPGPGAFCRSCGAPMPGEVRSNWYGDALVLDRRATLPMTHCIICAGTRAVTLLPPNAKPILDAWDRNAPDESG